MITPKYENKVLFIKEEVKDEDGNTIGVNGNYIESEPILVNGSDKFKVGDVDIRYYNDDDTPHTPDKKEEE